MKYLKRFDEELKPWTYKKAALQLRKIAKEKPVLAKAISAEERAQKLEDYYKEAESREQFEKWKKEIEINSKYGEFNIQLSRPGTPRVPDKVFSCYLSLVSEIESLEESWDAEDDNNRSINFGFVVGLIPKTVEDVKEIMEFYNSDFHNGFFFSLWIYVEYAVVNSELIFKGIKIFDYDSPSKCQIADRKSANSLKKLLVNIFDSKFDYPSGYSDNPNMYDHIERRTIQGLDIEVNYGLDMEKIRQDIQKLPIINFYKER